MRLLSLPTLILICTSLCGGSTAHSHHSRQMVSGILQPSRDSLLRQNQCIDQMQLERIANEQRLSEMVAAGTLEALPVTDAVQIAPSLPANRRYALPRTVSFLLYLSEAYRQEFGVPLQVDSAVIPVSVQRQLRRYNASAAPPEGEVASSHEAGTTFDLSRRMSRKQTKWMEHTLSYYQTMNVAVVEEERHCFHIQVIGDTE